jgi:hypothetical protein
MKDFLKWSAPKKSEILSIINSLVELNSLIKSGVEDVL